MCLSGEQESTFDRWIKQHKIACPVCGEKQLEHAEPVLLRRFSIDLGRHPGGGAEDPILRLFCPTYAYVLHFRAVQVLNLPEEGGKWV